MRRMNAFGRIAVCGAIAGYDGAPLTMAQPGADPALAPDGAGLHRLRASGRLAGGPGELGGLVAPGELTYRETVAEGLAQRAGGVPGPAEGRNFGKQLVKLV